MARTFPEVVALRVTALEKSAIEAAAAADGTSSSELLRRAVVPAVAGRIAALLARKLSPAEQEGLISDLGLIGKLGSGDVDLVTTEIT
jgi:uncharacterized protein (DUF1778 family)